MVEQNNADDKEKHNVSGSFVWSTIFSSVVIQTETAFSGFWLKMQGWIFNCPNSGVSETSGIMWCSEQNNFPLPIESLTFNTVWRCIFLVLGFVLSWNEYTNTSEGFEFSNMNLSERFILTHSGDMVRASLLVTKAETQEHSKSMTALPLSAPAH